MTSMIAYVGKIKWLDKDQRPEGLHVWNTELSFAENISRYNVDDQLRCYLEQLLGLVYYNLFYGHGCCEPVNDYIKEILVDVKCRFLPLAYRSYILGGDRKSLTDVVKNLASFLSEGTWERNPAEHLDLLMAYLDNYPYKVTPIVWREEFAHTYAAMLAWLSQNPEIKLEGCRFGLMGFRMYSNGWDGTVKLILAPFNAYSIGSSFFTKGTESDQSSIEILRFLSHFDLSNIQFEKLVGGLGEMCFNLDVRRSGQTMSQVLFACVRSNVLCLGSLAGCTPMGMTDIDRYKSQMFNSVIKFIAYARKEYGVEIKSPELLGRLLFCVAETKEQKDSASSIRAQGGSASADQLESFNQALEGLEALQFISQSTTLLSAQSQVAGSEESTEKTDDKTTTKSESSTTEVKTETKETEGAKKDDNEEDDNTRDDLTPTDDASSDKRQDDNQDDAEGNNDTDEEPGTSGEEPTAAGDDMPPSDEQPNTSDDNGIPFEIVNPDSETSDTVMWREEMNNFLANVLANPPEDLSPQDIATLTALQRFWLQSLSIETIMGIVGSCIRQLPESLTKLSTKCGVKNNE